MARYVMMTLLISDLLFGDAAIAAWLTYDDAHLPFVYDSFG